MAKYKAFISYRKTHATSAELVKITLVEEFGFYKEEIFLDKHNIGPEFFDKKLRKAILSSGCVILIVTKDCFKVKKDGDDWFIEEIRTAINNGIKIIPILFDDIRSLKEKNIVQQLNLSFDKDDLEIISKSQSIPYKSELSDATFAKVADFIDAANETKKSKLLIFLKSILTCFCILASAFLLFVGVGFLFGFFSSETDIENIIVDNTHIEGNTVFFEFGGLEAKYDLDLDSIYIELNEYTGELPHSGFEVLAHSCSVSGAVVLFNKNISNIKYLKFLRSGSKHVKMINACLTVAVCFGSFSGFSQGSKWGRTLKQQKEAILLFPKLKNKYIWAPAFSENNFLKMKYNKNIIKNKYEIIKVTNDNN